MATSGTIDDEAAFRNQHVDGDLVTILLKLSTNKCKTVD